MAKRLTSKQRASRIPLDYHRHADGIRANRRVLTALAAIVAVSLVIGTAISRDWHAAAVSPGPVARVHATWEQKCSACHQSFEPIRADAWFAAGNTEGGFAAAVLKCEECHAGSRHFSQQSVAEKSNCTTCHHEHGGRDAHLSAVEDRTCTTCHADLEKHVASASSESGGALRHVASFDRQHPEFRSLERDPTQLKFNHRLHLSPGLKLPEDRRPGWTLADVDPAVRDQYRSEGELANDKSRSSLVQLDCGNCHRAASSLGTSPSAIAKQLSQSASPLSSEMLPVTYDQHCRGCHPVTVQRDDREIVPHGMELSSLRQLLAGRYWETLFRERPQLATIKSRTRPIPGETPDPAFREAESTITQQVQEAERHLMGVTCVKCHEFQPPVAANVLPLVKPVTMPTVWLRHARFDHAAHRAVDCRECHARAYADDAEASTQTRDVLIAGQAKCRECHSPPDNKFDRGGADFRCIECHRYHHAELDGPPSVRKLPPKSIRHALPQFLRGDHARD